MSFLSSVLLSPPHCRQGAQLRAAVAGKTVLITGASFGIGEATALLLAEAGAEVLLIARSAEKLEALVAQIRAQGGRATAYPADLYKLETLPALLAIITAHHPKIELLICNAGKSIRRRATESFGRDDLARSLALNLTGPAQLVATLVPLMQAHGGGQVVSVSTVAARLPGAPRWGTYQGSKGGFDLWFRSVAGELRPQKIVLSSVYLPLVRTRMSAASGLFDRVPALTAHEAAQVLAYAIVRRADRVAPWWLRPCELLATLLPTLVERTLTWGDQRSP